MKKRIYHIVLTCAALLMSVGCSNFLEEISSDQIVPKSAKDYSEFLYGEIYYNWGNVSQDGTGGVDYIHPWLDIMTDDYSEYYEDGIWGDNRMDLFGYYTWQADPELTPDNVRIGDIAWETYYHHILIANITLDGMAKVAESPEAAQVRAEAYMIRAYAYFMLVNLYGEPYDPATADRAKGIPLNDMIGAENRKFQRASVAAVYKQITDDLARAFECFEVSGGGTTLFRWNAAAATVFASRVALFMQDWEGTIRYATAAWEDNPALSDLKEQDIATFFFDKANPEILFTFGPADNPYIRTDYGTYFASDDLVQTFETGDLRTGESGIFIRYLEDYDSYLECKYFNSEWYFDFADRNVYGHAIRTAEALMNRAEAYAHTNETQKALDDINNLRQNRFTAEDYTPLTAANGDILTLIKQERRREFCFEQMRWFDLRRWGCPRIEHVFSPIEDDYNTHVTYVLEENDPAYTLPLPYAVKQYDTVEDIVRPQRSPVK